MCCFGSAPAIDPLQWVEFGAEFRAAVPSWSTAGGVAPIEILLEANLNAAFLRIALASPSYAACSM